MRKLNHAVYDHDVFNIAMLSIISLLNVLYLASFVPFFQCWAAFPYFNLLQLQDVFYWILEVIFFIYLIIDSFWVFLVPNCVMANSNHIIIHHMMTLILVVIPPFIPYVRFHSAVAISVEFQTLVLICRRNVSPKSCYFHLLNCIFYICWIFFRLFLFPFLVFYTWRAYVEYSLIINSFYNAIVVAPPLFAILSIQGFMWTWDLIRKLFRKKNDQNDRKEID